MRCDVSHDSGSLLPASLSYAAIVGLSWDGPRRS